MGISLKTAAPSTSAPSTSNSYRLYFGNCYIGNTTTKIQYTINCKTNYDVDSSTYYNNDQINAPDYFNITINTILPNAGDPLHNTDYVVSAKAFTTEKFTVKQGGSTEVKNYGSTIDINSDTSITPIIIQSNVVYPQIKVVFKPTYNKIDINTRYPGLYHYTSAEISASYYTFDYKSTVIPFDYDYEMAYYPAVEGLLFKSCVSIGYKSSSYYDGILYEETFYNSGTGATIKPASAGRGWSYSYANKVSGYHIAEICTYPYTAYYYGTYYGWSIDNCYSVLEIKPYAYTRFQYPSTIDRIVKCVDVNSYFSNNNGVTYVQNGSISMASSETKAGNTEIFTSMPDKCVVYDSPAYLQVSIVPSSSGKGDEKYITKVNIHAYTGGTFQGTITMDATRYTTYKYNYIQKEKAYTFTFDVVTRKPNLNIISKKTTIPGVSWAFSGGGLSKTLTTDYNGTATATINNSKAEYAAIKVTALSIPETYKYLRPSDIYFKSDGFSSETCNFTADGSGNDYRNFTYTIGGSGIQQYNYDIEAYANFTTNEHLTTYVTAYGGAWFLNVPNFSVKLKTCDKYEKDFDYISSYSKPQFVNESYITSLYISEAVTIQPDASRYAYIGKVIVSKAKADGSGGKTELVSFTSNPKSTYYVTVVSEKTMLDTTYVTYVDVEVGAYNYPVCFGTNSVGKYTVKVNGETVKVSGFDVNTSITPITYVGKINLTLALPENTSYELENYKLSAYIYENAGHTGDYTVDDSFNTYLYADKYYYLNDILTYYDKTFSPYEVFVITPQFKVTAAPAPVSIISKAVSGKYYAISIASTTKYVGLSDVTVASTYENSYVIFGSIIPEARQYSWDSYNSKLEYINSDETDNIIYNGIKEGARIEKPAALSGTLSKVVITPAFSNKTAFNISFQRYKPNGGEYAATPNYTSIKWFDNYISGESSLASGSNTVVLDTLLPYQDTFGIESITLDDKNYEITKIQSTIDNGVTWVGRTLGKSNSWEITGDTTVMPIIEQTVKEMYLHFGSVGYSDYTVVYSIDGTEQSPLNINSASSGASTVTFKSSSKIIFKSITFESVEYSINEIIINNTNYYLNNEYNFFNPSANYYDVKVTAKSDYSKIEYKLNVNAQNWTNNISKNFKYDVILSDTYFNLKTDKVPTGADTINVSYVSIDSANYCNTATMTLPVTYVGKGVPTSPNVDIMFYVDNDMYDYKVKLSGYSPYTATYTSSGDYNWTVPVSKAFELNSQKQISYIVQVSATTYNFRGTLVPYNIKNQTSITTGSVPFGVSKGVKTTYTLTDPATIGVAPENYGIMVSKAQIEVSTDTWQSCKYKLALSPTTVPVNKSYATLNICNYNNYYSQTNKVSVKVNGSNAFDNTSNEVALAYLVKIGIPYKLNNPNSTTFSLKITSDYDKSFALYTYEGSASTDYIATSNVKTGILEYSFDIEANKRLAHDTFFIKHIS